MDTNRITTTSRSRFRFRDQTVGEDSPEIRVGYDSSSSFSGDVEFEPELVSMTGKGISRLCSELLELKKASEEDFQQNIFSNYSAFVRIFEEMKGMEVQLLQLKHHVSTQKMLVKDFKEEIYMKITLDENVESVIEESLYAESSPASILITHTENVCDMLDTLLSEHKLDESLDILEMEAETFQNMQFQDNIPVEVLMSYESAISERRAMLADQFKVLASNHRVRAAEFEMALVGLCRLGESSVATELLLSHYHSRISSGINDLQYSETYSYGIYIRGIAKLVFSLISQAARSFRVLHGETCPYAPEFMQWAYEETEVFAKRFGEHVGSISETSGGLSAAVEAVHFAMSYCSLLEPQRLLLESCLIDYIRPCMDSVLQIHFNHFKKVIKIFTSTDAWLLGRYPLSGILPEQHTVMITGEQSEYCLLTNSGRKFITMLQAIMEDISTLVFLQMEGSVFKALTDLFTEYTVILESSLDEDKYAVEKADSRINLAGSLVQEVSVIANLSTLVNIFSGIIRSIFKESSHLDFEVDSYISFTQETCSRLRADLCEQFIHRIMSLKSDHVLPSNGRVWTQDDSDSSQNMMPSAPYQVLYAELRKLEKLVEENFNEDWLMDYLRDLIEAIFVWVSRNEEAWTIVEDSTYKHSEFMKQFALDIQFLVEIARSGGYLTNIMVTDSLDILARMESVFGSADQDPNRSRIDYEWAVDAAVEALEKLQELEQRKLNPDEASDNLEELTEEDVHYLRDFLEDDDDNDDVISYSEDSIESLEDSVTKDAPSVDTISQTHISTEGGTCLTGDMDEINMNAETNVSSEAISLTDGESNDISDNENSVITTDVLAISTEGSTIKPISLETQLKGD